MVSGTVVSVLMVGLSIGGLEEREQVVAELLLVCVGDPVRRARIDLQRRPSISAADARAPSAVVIVGIVAPLRLVGSVHPGPAGIYARDLAARARRATAVAVAACAE